MIMVIYSDSIPASWMQIEETHESYLRMYVHIYKVYTHVYECI